MRYVFAGIIVTALGFANIGFSAGYTQRTFFQSDDFYFSDLTLMPSGHVRLHADKLSTHPWVFNGTIFDVSPDGRTIEETKVRSGSVRFGAPILLPGGGTASYDFDGSITFWGRDFNSATNVALPVLPQPYFEKGAYVSPLIPDEVVVLVQRNSLDSEYFVQYLDVRGNVIRTSDLLFKYIKWHETRLLENGRLLFVGHDGNTRTFIALIEIDGQVLWRRSLNEYCSVPLEFQADILVRCPSRPFVLTQENIEKGPFPIPTIEWEHAIDRKEGFLYLADSTSIYRLDSQWQVVHQARVNPNGSLTAAMAFGDHGLGVIFEKPWVGQEGWTFATFSPELNERGRSAFTYNRYSGSSLFLSPLPAGFVASFNEYSPQSSLVRIFDSSAAVLFEAVQPHRWLGKPLPLPDGSVLVPASNFPSEVLKFTPVAPEGGGR